MDPLALPARTGRKTYDEAYFHKWYRDPRTRVHTRDAVRRKVHMVLGVAEYFLKRKVRTVLDVGAGEGTWFTELRRVRPSVRYTGLDPSEYVVRKHGRAKNIRLGTFEELPTIALAEGYDLIVCADVLQYVSTPAVKRGVKRLASLLEGVAFLEAYTSGDDMEGDLEGWHQRSKSEYRRLFAGAGLRACGVHCYLAPEVAENAVELELV